MTCSEFSEYHISFLTYVLTLGLKLIGDVFFKRLVQRDKVTADDFETKLCKFHHELIILSFAPCLIQKQETKKQTYYLHIKLHRIHPL